MTTITVTYDTAGSGTWLCPAGVTSITVACWGAGGGGGGYDSTTTTCGGGGGGGAYAYESAVTVTPGNLYPWSVGTGGHGGTPVRGGNAGGSSSLAGDTLTVTANGGQEGYNGSAGGSGGAGGAAGGNSTAYGGGDGAASAEGVGGGGGSSAGTGASGNSATGGIGATAPAGGGDGGRGGLSGSLLVPVAGSAPGGAGGGAGGNETTGADGAAGKIIITYTATIQPAVPFFPAGYAPMPGDFNAWVQAPLAFLTNKIVFRAALTTATTLPSGAALVIPFNDILEDPYSGWNATAYQWVCPGGYTGLYQVTVTATCVSTGGAPSLQARAAINSQAYEYAVDTTFVPAAASGIASGAVPVQLYGGTDSVQGIAFMLGTQGTTDSVAGRQCELVVTWLAS